MLNKQQKQAVEYSKGPLCVIAGAGTGKTFTLISKIDYLIREKNYDSRRILTITFTNKAAGELKERLSAKGHKDVYAMTFHGLCAFLLKRFWKKDFEIFDAVKQIEVLRKMLPDYKENDFRSLINDLISFREKEIFTEKNIVFVSGLNESVIKGIFSEYEKQLNKNNVLDFHGLIYNFLKLINDKEVLQKIQGLFDYILVDEYQDTNDLQIEIIKKLAEKHQNICVVGDDDQTIYSWRGANEKNMAEFRGLFDNVKMIFLEKNYRNPPCVLNGAMKLIKNNPQRIEKSFVSAIKDDNKIRLFEANNEFEEMEMLDFVLGKYLGSTGHMHIADEIDNEKQGEFVFSDIAFLYRTQVEGKRLAEHLAKKGYPYQISSGKYFWHKKEIKSFIKELERLQHLQQFPELRFSEWMGQLLDSFIESQSFRGVKADLLRQLVLYAVQFDALNNGQALENFLIYVQTQQEADNLMFADRINLMTLHACKGLEFPIVMIFGLEEGIIPYKKLINDDYFLAEERRLLFVGMTRALKYLHLFTRQKYLGDNQEKSRFLKEIGEECIKSDFLPERKVRSLKRRELKKAQMKMF